MILAENPQKEIPCAGSDLRIHVRNGPFVRTNDRLLSPMSILRYLGVYLVLPSLPPNLITTDKSLFQILPKFC
jgi:hypothetical protein